MAEENPKSVAEMAAEIKADHAKRVDEVKALAEEALGKAQSGEAVTASLKEKADEALTRMNELAEQVTSMDQKLARAKAYEDAAAGQKSIGEMFTEDEKVKAFLASDSKRGRVELSTKATITLATTNAAGSAGDGAQATRLPGIQTDPDRRLTVRDLLMPGQMDGNTLEYVQEAGFTNSAEPVAEGARKPESDIQLTLKSTTAKVIAHYMKASRQVLDDVSQLRSYIDGRLLYGLAYVEEQQLLNGDGTGQNLHGIIPQATAYAAPGGITTTTPTAIDQLRFAMLQAALAEYPATGHVMHPIDWTRIETTKDADGRYIIGNPQGTARPTLWGLPVVATQAIEQDKFLTGAFRLGAQVFDRWRARVEVATENEDDFVKNLVTILAEERLALAVYRPQAFVYGDFGDVT